jgi:hypothetical protein
VRHEMFFPAGWGGSAASSDGVDLLVLIFMLRIIQQNSSWLACAGKRQEHLPGSSDSGIRIRGLIMLNEAPQWRAHIEGGPHFPRSCLLPQSRLSNQGTRWSGRFKVT